MRPHHATPRAAAVHQLAHHTLALALDWKPFRKSVSVRELLDMLLLMASTARTLYAITRLYFSFSHETARQAVRTNLGDLDTLTAGLNKSLHSVLEFSRTDRRRPWTVAIDTHNMPYYGDRSTPYVIGGQKKEGTKFFFVYATAVLIHRHRRYTVALMPVKKGQKPHEIVATLLDLIARHGLIVGGVVLDSGFDSGETILDLQDRKLSYTVPLRRKGRGTNRRNACFSWAHGTVGSVDWVTEKTRQEVSTRVLVWQRAGQPQAKVYAFSGWDSGQAVKEARRAWTARRHYRERFGIETSYRQKNQSRAWTTSDCVKYRLLLEGLAHLLRQVWVRLTEQMARALKLKPKAWVGYPVLDLLEQLADHVKPLYRVADPISQAPKDLELGQAC